MVVRVFDCGNGEAEAPVEHRRGGAEGRTTWYEHDDEDRALDQLRDLLIGDGWREL